MTTRALLRGGPCEACRFWDSQNDVRGLCRVDAPFPDPRSEGGLAYWPSTAATDWCGRFAPAQTLAASDEQLTYTT